MIYAVYWAAEDARTWDLAVMSPDVSLAKAVAAAVRSQTGYKAVVWQYADEAEVPVSIVL